MIEPEKPALIALHDVLILARDMGYSGVDGRRISDVLDSAEYLVQLIADREDRTGEFIQALIDLAARNALFASAVDRFQRAAAIGG